LLDSCVQSGIPFAFGVASNKQPDFPVMGVLDILHRSSEVVLDFSEACQVEGDPFPMPTTAASKDQALDRAQGLSENSSSYNADDEMGRPCGVADSCRPAARLMEKAVAAIVISNTDFGVFAKRFVYGDREPRPGRLRDIFPLPRIESLSVFGLGTSLPVPEQVFLTHCNLGLAGLAFMAGQQNAAVDRRPTKLQVAVQRRAVWKTWRLVMRLNEYLDGASNITFSTFVGRGSGSKYQTLNAVAIDGLGRCGLVDPSCFLDDATRETIKSPDRMFPGGLKAAGLRATVDAADRGSI
jgi:hypothetical protein